MSKGFHTAKEDGHRSFKTHLIFFPLTLCLGQLTPDSEWTTLRQFQGMACGRNFNFMHHTLP